MSRLRARIGRLEQAAARQGCPGCANQPAVIDLLGPDSKPRNESELTACPRCGERPQLLSVRLAFDPDRFLDTDNGCEGGEQPR